MTLTQLVGVAALLGALIQSGALIFYAGVLTSTVRNHDRRIDKLEEAKDAAARDLAYIEGSRSS